jgi:hypothetical protein
MPAAVARRGRHAQGAQALGHAGQAAAGLQVLRDHVAHHCRRSLLDAHSGRIPWVLGIQPVAVGCPRPGQQHAGLELTQSAPAHPFGDECALVLGDCAAHLQEQLVMRVLAHGPFQERDLAPAAGPLVQEQHLVHVMARQAVRRGHQHAVQGRGRHRIAQPLESWPAQVGAAGAVVAEDVLLAHVPPLGRVSRHVRLQPRELLLNARRLRWSLGRNPHVDPYPHEPPRRRRAGRLRQRPLRGRLRPLREQLGGAVPPLLRVGVGLRLPADAPLPFHRCLPVEPPQREHPCHAARPHRAHARGSATRSAGGAHGASGKTCHL